MPLESKLLLLVDAEAIVAIGKSSDSSSALSSSSLSRWATISSYVPVSRRAILTDRFSFGGSFAYNKLSIMLFAFSPKAFSAPWFSSSKKSGNFMVFGSKVSRCHLCFAVAWDSGLTYFLRNMISTSSSVWRLIEFMFLKVCRAPFLSNEWKWFIFICSVMAGCILIIVWNKSSKSSNFSLFPSNVIGVVWTGRIVIVWGLFCKLTSTSANLLSGSWGDSVTSGSGAGRVVYKETLWLDCCLSRFGIEWIRPVRNSGIGCWASLAPVTM